MCKQTCVKSYEMQTINKKEHIIKAFSLVIGKVLSPELSQTYLIHKSG